VAAFGRLKKIKMATVAMITKVQKNFNSLQTSEIFAVMFPVTSKHFLNPPFFRFHGNCGKVCPTDSDCFGLSRSTNKKRGDLKKK
jgi:hypothetical protein